MTRERFHCDACGGDGETLLLSDVQALNTTTRSDEPMSEYFVIELTRRSLATLEECITYLAKHFDRTSLRMVTIYDALQDDKLYLVALFVTLHPAIHACRERYAEFLVDTPTFHKMVDDSIAGLYRNIWISLETPDGEYRLRELLKERG
jgi:hypothetical protein